MRTSPCLLERSRRAHRPRARHPCAPSRRRRRDWRGHLERVERREGAPRRVLASRDSRERDLVARHALAVVLEVGLDSLRRSAQLVALGDELAQIGFERGFRRGVLARRRCVGQCAPSRSPAPAADGSGDTGRRLAPGHVRRSSRRRRSRRRRPRRRSAEPVAPAPASLVCRRLRRRVDALRELLARRDQRLVRRLHRFDVGTGKRVLQALERVVDLRLLVGRDLVALVLQQLLGLEHERVGVVADLGFLAAAACPPRRAPRRPSSCGRSRPCRARCRR